MKSLTKHPPATPAADGRAVLKKVGPHNRKNGGSVDWVMVQ
jgi:hypothetical protein